MWADFTDLGRSCSRRCGKLVDGSETGNTEAPARVIPGQSWWKTKLRKNSGNGRKREIWEGFEVRVLVRVLQRNRIND